ncbi:YlxR family protein [Serinicoccus sediminis]|uniref:YlxR family protein n=1 Tax=Serinicoccus sediminis TaxID=2306021 RepID=UPI001EDFBC6D|nr:YlxR family protein [Serinicoccus sediminis]
MRTCVGCRRRDEQAALLRLVARLGDDGSWTVVPDERRRLPGRGAYVHRRPGCVESAVARRAVVRALRLPASAAVDLADVLPPTTQQR